MKTNTIPIQTELVLIGGGHANIQVLKSFAMRPIDGLRVSLISDVLNAPYSGMLPGFISGKYSHCLLYTSPSPRDLSTSRMPSSA